MTNILLLFDKTVFWHSTESFVIIGLIATLLGLLVGRWAWGQCRANAQRVDSANAELRKTYDKLKASQSKIDRLVDEL